jgi:hypothetical protein
MRDDLLDAQAAIDWAVSDLPILQAKIDAWLNDAPYTLFGDLDSKPGEKIIRLRNVKLIPAIINAEAGVILHSIRSSLDILAVALAERNGATGPKDVYFPVWKDVAAFTNPRDKTIEKIKRLSTADQAVIKDLKPYKGGNDYLFALHDLDITRKHRRLVSVFSGLSAILISAGAARDGVKFVPVWQGFKNEAILATAPARASESHIHLDLEIRFTEPRIVSHRPLIKILREFASLAESIIALFDGPEL